MNHLLKIENWKLEIAGFIALSLLFLIPIFAHAATFSAVVNKMVDLLNTFVGLFIGFAVFFTAYAVFKYFIAGAEGANKADAVKMITWGIVGIMIMVSIWGVVSIVANTFFDEGDLTSPGGAENIIDSELRGG